MGIKGRFLFDEQAQEKRRWMLFAAGACVVAGACMLFGVGQTLQLKIQDAWYGVRGDRVSSPQVVIVGIDGKALNAEEERWPWPRDTYVPLIEKLNQAGAKVIGFDIAFGRTTAEDAAFAGAMRESGNVVFGMVFNDAGDRSPPSGAPPPQVLEQAVPHFSIPFLRVIPAPGVEPPSPATAPCGGCRRLSSTEIAPTPRSPCRWRASTQICRWRSSRSPKATSGSATPTSRSPRPPRRCSTGR
jgi:hypothetical protein